MPNVCSSVLAEPGSFPADRWRAAEGPSCALTLPQDEPFTPSDWERHRSWRRHCPEPRIFAVRCSPPASEGAVLDG